MPKPDLNKLTTTELDAHLANIFQRSEAAEAGLARLVAERRALAVHAASGDAKAEASMRAMNELHGSLASEIDICRLAADEVSEHRRAAAQREAALEREARLSEAEEVAARLIAASDGVDIALRAAVAALEKRRELALELARLGYPANRFHHLDAVARAAGAAGMRGRLNFIPGPMEHWRPLGTQDRGTVDMLLGAALQARRAAA